MLSWFSADEAQKFGVTLAKFFMERVPLEPGSTRKRTLERKKEILEKMFAQITQFKEQHKLNVYKKAKLGNAFKWELKEAGYDPEFVDLLTKEIAIRL